MLNGGRYFINALNLPQHTEKFLTELHRTDTEFEDKKMQTVEDKHQERKSDRLLDMKQVCYKTRMSKTVIYELLKISAFPAKIKIGRMTRFSENEIDRWIEEAKAQRVEHV